MSDKPLNVSARAREAAAELSRRRGDFIMIQEQMIAGSMDESNTVQAFATFERDLLEEAAKVAEECGLNGLLAPGIIDGISMARRQIAAAIRALTPESPSNAAG